MNHSAGILVLGLALWGAMISPGWAATTQLAGGCFWCMEADFEKLPGVSGVVSGFAGGDLPNPTYRGDHSGHYETVEISYDPAVVSYAQLLDHFWKHIDPFDGQGQFCDKGESYRSAIFVASAEERRLAEASKRAVQQRFPDRTVVTPILPAGTFWPATDQDSYHQDYYKNNPVRYNFYRWSCGRDQRLEDIWGED